MENLDLEALLECYGKLPEVDDELIKEYQEIVKKLKMFVKAAEETATSPETAPTAKAILVTMDGIAQEFKSQGYAATMKRTLADLKGIKDELAKLKQLDSQDLETVWSRIEGVCEKVKSCFGLETTDIRKESCGNPMQGIECVREKLKGMHHKFITSQINWQMGMSAMLGLATLVECWGTYTILNNFSIEKSRYDKKLQEITETLSDVEKRTISLINDLSRGQAVKPSTVERLMVKLQRASDQLDSAKELLQANKSTVSFRRTGHFIGTVSSLVATYRSISEYFLASSAGLSPFHQALTVASAAICGVSAIAHGTMAYKCHKAIEEAAALLKEIKAYEERLASVAQATEDFLRLLQEKINSASKSAAILQDDQGMQDAPTVLPQVALGLAILVAVVWGYFT